MKANELRRNNIVGSYNSGAQGKEPNYMPLKVLGIGPFELQVTSNVDKLEACVVPYRINLVDTSPIPITDDWLLQLGFEKDFLKDFYLIRLEEYNLEVSVNGFSGTLEKEPDWFCSITSYSSKSTFTNMYVHQLQNLYFALTGNELEIVKEPVEN